MNVIRIRLLAVVLLLAPFACGAEETPPVAGQTIIIDRAASRVEDGLVRLNAQVDFSLPSAVITALNKGIELVFITEVQAMKKRNLLPDKRIADLQLRRRLRFHALTRKYIVDDLTFSKQASFDSLTSALAQLGHYEDITIIQASLATESKVTHIRMRVQLSRNELPLPLRLKSYLGFSWSPSSDWHRWSF